MGRRHFLQIFNVTVLLFLASYVILKRRFAENAWMVGSSSYFAMFLAVFPAAGSIAMTVFTIIDDYELFGIPRINVVSFAAIVVIGVVLHATLLYLVHKFRMADQMHIEETIGLISRRETRA
jgi:hypothetical protein